MDSNETRVCSAPLLLLSLSLLPYVVPFQKRLPFVGKLCNSRGRAFVLDDQQEKRRRSFADENFVSAVKYKCDIVATMTATTMLSKREINLQIALNFTLRGLTADLKPVSLIHSLRIISQYWLSYR